MSNKKRALLLAAGMGTRLRPLTLKKPKCLVEIAGKPMLEHWLVKLEAIECEAVLINTHYMKEHVEEFVKNRKKSGMRIQTIHESKLLGTAGTLIENEKFFKDRMGLLIHADNAMKENLDTLIKIHQHERDKYMLTMLTFKTENPRSCGIIEFNNEGKIKKFHEKVSNPPGNLANGAVYVFESGLIEAMKEITPRPIEFSNDVIPYILDHINTYETKLSFIDIGTPNNLLQAQTIWKDADEK